MVLLNGVYPPKAGDSERRRSQRFTIERGLSYKTLNRNSDLAARILVGNGTTINISSSGVLFSSEHDLPVGTHVELSISWPAKLDDKCFLSLIARGHVNRSGKGQVALQIEKYEIRP